MIENVASTLHLKAEAKKNALHVPQETVLNRFIRYENHCMNKMTEAEHKLERCSDSAAGMRFFRRPREAPPLALKTPFRGSMSEIAILRKPTDGGRAPSLRL